MVNVFKLLNDLAVAELIIILGGVGMIVQECLNMFNKARVLAHTPSCGCAEHVHTISSKDCELVS